MLDDAPLAYLLKKELEWLKVKVARFSIVNHLRAKCMANQQQSHSANQSMRLVKCSMLLVHSDHIVLWGTHIF